MKEKLTNQIDEFKNVISVLPTNNAKNREKKIELLNEELSKVNKLIKETNEEIEKRLVEINKFGEEKDLEKLNKELEATKILSEWNKYNTPYEKMHLDYYLYQIHRYYKDDLESLNSCIKRILASFSKVNINLTDDDFNYSPYVKEYIKLLQTSEDNKTIKDKFEEIYWKYPDLLRGIEYNFRSIYRKYRSKIIKYYDERKKEFLKTHNIKELENARINLKEEISYEENQTKESMINKFINHDLLITDFDEGNIIKRKTKFFDINDYDVDVLSKYYGSLRELKVYLSYKYLLDDMITKINEKDTYKDKKNNIHKELDKIEKEYLKLTIPKKSLFGGVKKLDEKSVTKTKDLIKQMQYKYEEYDEVKFEDIIYNELTANSSIFDVLKCVASNYLYFVKKTKELDESLTIKELTNRFQELNDLLYDYKYNVLASISLNDNKDIQEVICDKYKMDKVRIPEEDIDVETINTLMNDIEILVSFNNIEQEDYTVEDIYLLLEMNKRKRVI